MSTGGVSSTSLTWAAYLAEVLPAILSEAGLTSDCVSAVIEDVGTRAQGYAAGGRSARRALRTPFLDDVVGFEPAEAPLPVRADVAVVVRNSLLEDQHAAGLVDDNCLAEATYLACAPLHTWLRDHSNLNEHDPPTGPFAAMADFPRAHAALQALAVAAEAGGRRAFKSPKGAVMPELPTVREGEVERTATGFVRRSAISELDPALVQILRGVADGEIDFLAVSSLSRYSRDSVLLAHTIEVALAHAATILTTNLMLRSGEVFARRPPFAASQSRRPFADIDDKGLSGVHAKRLREVVAQNELSHDE